MKVAKRIRLIVITLIVLGVLSYAAYMCVNFFFYDDYKKYLTGYTDEEGKEFKELSDSDPKIKGMVLVAENDTLKLYTNTTTTEVAVYDKRNGEITYSNPVDRDSDPIANGRNKIDLSSQFMLTYYDSSMTEVTMYNYDYSVLNKQFQMESINNGIRYTYLCGNLTSPTGLVPPFITEERLQEKILSKLSEKDAKSVRKNYMDSETVSGFLELTTGAQASKIGMEKLNKLMEQAGYTQEDFDADQAAAAGGSLPERTTFTVALEYRLDGDKLVVSVPTDRIKETGTGRLGYISLLSYFAAGSSKEDGYILVPNASGSLINFNNGKKTEQYNQYVYDMDPTAQSWTLVENVEQARLPIYGIKREKSAVFAEITGGDTLANISAQVAGNTNSYNYVYPTFQIRGSEVLGMFGVVGNMSDLPTLEKNIYNENLQVTYAFLDEKNANYSGMANYYRNELISRGELAQKQEEENIPFYLDMLGGVKMERSVMAVPYMTDYPMTTFDEAGKITDAFYDQQITNLRVNYLGWFNGGYYHNVPKNIKVESKLGGKKDLEDLNKKLTEAGSRLFGDVAFQKVSYTSKHYNREVESAMWYSGYPLFFGRLNPARLRQEDSLGYPESLYNVLSPKYLPRYVGDFLKDMNKLDLSGVSLRDLGDYLSADKRRTNVIDRQKAKQLVESQLKVLDDATDYLMISGGNAYAWAYATDLENVPDGDNPYYIVDEEVPFYQMVIHGSIDYTSGAINLSDSYDKQDIILRSIEYGTAPHFALSYKESSNIKYSAMNTMYTTQYTTWMSDAVEIYQKTNEALKNVVNSKITDHTILESGVKRVTYDNGVIIYINTNSTDVTADNVSIPAKSYVIEGVK